jgi:hypothetical protein
VIIEQNEVSGDGGVQERRGRVMIERIKATSMKTNNPITTEGSIL